MACVTFHRPLLVWLTALAAAMVVLGCPQTQNNPPSYSIIKLDPREGDALSLNEKGEVVGYVWQGNSRLPFLWQTNHSPKLTLLGTLGRPDGYATDINLYTQICGAAATNEGVLHAFRWTSSGGMEDLGVMSPEPELDKSIADGINDSGVVVGRSYQFPGHRQAFRWREDEGMLPVPGAGDGSRADGVNAFSSIVGNIFVESQVVGAPPLHEGRVWLNYGVENILANPWGSHYVAASAMNDFHVVVGEATDNEFRTTAFRWSLSKGMTKLPNLGYYVWPDSWPNAYISQAYGINNNEDIVGTAVSPEGDPSLRSAVLWRGGKVYDLNKAIPKTSGWVHLDVANAVNNKGCIVGKGSFIPGKDHAFLLVPVVLVSLSVTPVTVVGGQVALVQAFVSGAAPLDLEVSAELTGNLTRFAHLPSSVVMIAEGKRMAEFQVQTSQVANQQSGEIRVTWGGTELRAGLVIVPR